MGYKNQQGIGGASQKKKKYRKKAAAAGAGAENLGLLKVKTGLAS